LSSAPRLGYAWSDPGPCFLVPVFAVQGLFSSLLSHRKSAWSSPLSFTVVVVARSAKRGLEAIAVRASAPQFLLELSWFLPELAEALLPPQLCLPLLDATFCSNNQRVHRGFTH